MLLLISPRANHQSETMQHRFHDARDKFSSLAPLSTTGVKIPWWMLTESQLPVLSFRQDESIQRIRTADMLQLMLKLVDTRSASEGPFSQNFWQSPCSRFCIGFHKPTVNVASLYVQRRKDYFACVELYVDGELTVAFSEPVWPHLQRRPARPVDTLSVFTQCLDAIRDGIARAAQLHTGLADSGSESSTSEKISQVSSAA